MNSVNTPPDAHVFVLLDQAMRRLKAEMAGRSRATIEAATPPGLAPRASQLRLLALVPEDGSRIGELADRAHMTPQALGEFVRELEGLGLVEIEVDPADRRVRRVALTPDGRRLGRAGEDAVRAMEADVRQRVGAERWDNLRAGLQAILDLPD